jgi:hypothetical protein
MVSAVLVCRKEKVAMAQDQIDELQNAVYAASEARRKLESDRSSERYKAINEFERKLDADVLGPKYDEPLRLARQTENEARRALTAEKDRVALASVGEAPFPLGTRFIEWKKIGHGRYQSLGKATVAVLEVFTSASVAPSNQSYGKANIGDYVLRVLKKDGTPSARYIKPSRDWNTNNVNFRPWFPEGVDPSQEES